MAGQFTVAGLEKILGGGLQNITVENWQLRLSVANWTPAYTSVIGDITEATDSTYAPIDLVGATWVLTDSGGITTATYPQQSFTFTSGGETVYGFYLVGSSSTTTMYFGQLAAAPFLIPTGGAVVKVDLVLNIANL